MKNQFTDYTSSFNEKIFNLISAESVVLDVGCNSGNLGKELIQQKKCIVDGIDYNPEAIQIAKTVNQYRDCHLADFNSNLFDLKIKEKQYDFIIFADILEHLINPEITLSYLSKSLKANGQIIISLPNVAFLLNRLQLLFGNWNYRQYGILDKTHLRFYTFETGKKLIKDSGLNFQKLIPYNQFGILRKLNLLMNLFPSLISYQFIVIAGVE